MENGYDLTTRGICLSMVFAHWLYWGAALVSAISTQLITSRELRELGQLHLNLLDTTKAFHDSPLPFHETPR